MKESRKFFLKKFDKNVSARLAGQTLPICQRMGDLSHQRNINVCFIFIELLRIAYILIILTSRNVSLLNNVSDNLCQRNECIKSFISWELYCCGQRHFTYCTDRSLLSSVTIVQKLLLEVQNQIRLMMADDRRVEQLVLQS